MSERKTYTREEVYKVVKQLEREIIARRDHYDTPQGFVSEHPWTEKFLRIGYFEANSLFNQSRDSGFSILPLPISEIELALRKRHNLPIQIRFQNTGNGAKFIFAFEETEGGFYTPTKA
jgi:hypothetical protein